MKFPCRFVLAGAAFLAAASPLAASAQASEPAAGATRAAVATPHKIGLVDVGYIFSNYQKLKDRREALQKEIEASDGELKQIQEQVQAIQKELQSGTITKGSEAWTQREKQLTELSAQGQAKMSNLRREFARKEVQMYKETYDEVAALVEQYAVYHKYTLVLRYQREPSDSEAAEDPNKIMSRVNQLVVFHQEADDITDVISEYLNKQYAGQVGRAAAPATPVRR